jgi:membrane associated rhomboid family serine protease
MFFILLPVGVNYQTNRLPIVTFSLMALNVLVYLISLVLEINVGEDAEYWIIENLWLIPAYSSWPAYLTTMFVHAGFFHLLGNMLYLFLFGACVEDVIGRWKFLLFYLLGGVAAAFGHIAAIPDHFASEIPLGGASGAVTACIAGFLILFSKLEIDFRYFGFFLFRVFVGEFSLAAWVVISFWFAKDLFFATLDFTSKHSGGGVAFAAHVGGFLAGLAMIGIYRLLPKSADSEPDETDVAPWPTAPAPVMRPQRFAAPAPTETPTIFISEAGVESGPFTYEQVREMLALGSISADAFTGTKA